MNIMLSKEGIVQIIDHGSIHPIDYPNASDFKYFLNNFDRRRKLSINSSEIHPLCQLGHFQIQRQTDRQIHQLPNIRHQDGSPPNFRRIFPGH